MIQTLQGRRSMTIGKPAKRTEFWTPTGHSNWDSNGMCDNEQKLSGDLAGSQSTLGSFVQLWQRQHSWQGDSGAFVCSICRIIGINVLGTWAWYVCSTCGAIGKAITPYMEREDFDPAAIKKVRIRRCSCLSRLLSKLRQGFHCLWSSLFVGGRHVQVPLRREGRSTSGSHNASFFWRSAQTVDRLWSPNGSSCARRERTLWYFQGDLVSDFPFSYFYQDVSDHQGTKQILLELEVSISSELLPCNTVQKGQHLICLKMNVI